MEVESNTLTQVCYLAHSYLADTKLSHFQAYVRLVKQHVDSNGPNSFPTYRQTLRALRYLSPGCLPDGLGIFWLPHSKNTEDLTDVMHNFFHDDQCTKVSGTKSPVPGRSRPCSSLFRKKNGWQPQVSRISFPPSTPNLNFSYFFYSSLVKSPWYVSRQCLSPRYWPTQSYRYFRIWICSFLSNYDTRFIL